MRVDVLHLIITTRRLPTRFIRQLRTRHKKLIQYRPRNNPKPIANNMHPLYAITSNIRIKIKHNLPIIPRSRNVHPIGKKEQIVADGQARYGTRLAHWDF